MATTTNYEELKQGFDPSLLPVVFQDAAVLARSINITCLWIDTLCIIQDSREDWEEQAANMGQVFEGAAITIAASSSPDPYNSLFGVRETMYQEIELFSDAKEELAGVEFKARRKIDRGIHAKTGRSTHADPLDTRAWGLQERMLSTRLIAFTGAELQWTCRTLRACECHQKTYPTPPLFPDFTGTSHTETMWTYHKIWSKIIEGYSNRELKVPTDRLPALSGLAKRFGTQCGFSYNAGCWKETLLYDLVWQRDVTQTKVQEPWLSPSFSWVSVPGAVNFRLARHSYPGSRIFHAHVVDVHHSTTGIDIYGTAVDGSLTLRGHTVAAHLRRSSSKGIQVYTICIYGAEYTTSADPRAVCDFSIDASIPRYNAMKSPATEHQTACEVAIRTTSQMIEGPILLLSLYSIHHPRYLYQNFLIFARSHDGTDIYKRVGIGSGKLHRKNGCGASIPDQAHLVRPFEWLSVDSSRSGRSNVDVVEQVVCIR
jgi:hypothetical protein